VLGSYSFLPFIGILALIWALGALVFAIFPGNRVRRVKIAGITFAIFVVAIMASPGVERAAENQEMTDAGVSSREELAAVRAQQESDDAAAAEAVAAAESAAAVVSYVELVESQIAIVRELSAQEFTDSIDTIASYLFLINGWAQLIEEGRDFELTPEQEQVRQELLQTLSRNQVAVFPVVRDAYGPLLRQRLWEHDGHASTIGAGYRRIEIVNALFAANRNIADFHETVRDTLLELRFTRVDYKWFREDREFSYYTLEPPSDGTVGRWQGARFQPVD
jgi:hypothetical protein